MAPAWRATPPARSLGHPCARRATSPRAPLRVPASSFTAGCAISNTTSSGWCARPMIEREVVLESAPHLAWPLRLVMPHSPEQRPQWLIRLGLAIYDHLGGRKRIPGTRTVNLRRDPEGAVVRESFTRAFAYWDVWIDDARLVVLNAVDAAERGARVLTRTAFASARREGGLWRAELATRSAGGPSGAGTRDFQRRGAWWRRCSAVWPAWRRGAECGSSRQPPRHEAVVEGRPRLRPAGAGQAPGLRQPPGSTISR